MARFRYVKHGSETFVYCGEVHIGCVFRRYGTWWANSLTKNLHLSRHAAAMELLTVP